MTTPLPDMEWLYSSTYTATRKCSKCDAADWNEVKEGMIECKKCGNQEEV